MKTIKFNRVGTRYKTILPEAKGYVGKAGRGVSKLGRFGEIAGRLGAGVGAAVGAYETIKNIPKIKKGIKGLKKDYSAYRKSKRKQKDLFDRLINTSTKRKYMKKYGENSWGKSWEPGAIDNTDYNQRAKIEKEVRRKYRNLK